MDTEIIKVLPDAFYTLQSLKERTYPRTQQHPFSIWNLSFGEVIKHFDEMLDRLILCEATNKIDSAILTNYQNLLAALCKLWEDDSTEILKAFSTKKDIGKDAEVKIFNQGKKIYYTNPGKILNKIKHNQRQLVLRNAYIDGKIIPGFFVSVSHGGKWSPCPDVHYKEGDVAFSFYYEIRRLFLGLYLHGENLSKTIKNLEQIPDVSWEVDMSQQKQTLDRVNKLRDIPSMYFPNERNKPFPNIEGEELLKSIYHKSTKDKNITYFSKVTEELTHQGDGITRTVDLKPLHWNKFH